MGLRDRLRRFLWFQVGDGMSIHAWEDAWLPCGQLSSIISYRVASSIGISVSSTARDLVNACNGTWPQEWTQRYTELASVALPTLHGETRDKLVWRTANNTHVEFSVKQTYESLDGPRDVVPWHNSVWFKGHIPKHAFCMWVACRWRHPTQDRIRLWKHDPPDMKCSLCTQCYDSHDHLFFACQYANEVWNAVMSKIDWSGFPNVWTEIISALGDPMRRPKKMVQRLALSASVYFIWQERNRRMFSNISRIPTKLVKEIISVVMLRMAWKCKRGASVDDDE